MSANCIACGNTTIVRSTGLCRVCTRFMRLSEPQLEAIADAPLRLAKLLSAREMDAMLPQVAA